MNIYQIASETGVRIKDLKTLDEAKLLKCDSIDEEFGKLIYALNKGNPLSALQLVALLTGEHSPGELPEWQRDRVAEATAKLDNPRPADPMIVAAFQGARFGEPLALAKAVEWLKQVTPLSGAVDHHYFAVRILLGAGPASRKSVAHNLARAMLNCRNHPDFAGWWTVEQSGSRKVTKYLRPAKKEFDL